jgi:PadR family transcriptional regulator, regulatory protein PadR
MAATTSWPLSRWAPSSAPGGKLTRKRRARFWFDSRPSVVYMALQYMASPVPDRELKKGSAELMILALLENRPRHGYEIAQLIDLRSRGAIRFNVASLYPLLYRLEKRAWIRGRWVEKPGQRRRRYYRLTSSGKNVLSKQRVGWREFVEAINLITGIQHA